MNVRRAGIVGVLAVVTAGADAVRARTAQTAPTAEQTPAAAPQADLSAAIDALGAFDLAARFGAARTLRGAPPAQAVPALTRAGRSHANSYVRYKSLVLLTGFEEASIAGTMRSLLGDRDDRVRIVAASWFETHPDRTALTALLAQLDIEKSEYVRPALTRAIAAHGDDARVRDALLPLVTRGEDTFRGATIEAIGDYHGRFALDAIAGVAMLDGPLQEDAIVAIGRIGDQAGLVTLSKLQKEGPKARQPAIAAAVCLMGLDCAAQQEYLAKSLVFVSSRTSGAQPGATGAATATDDETLRGASRALGILAGSGRVSAFGPLIDAGVSSKDPDRVAIAVALGEAAMRNPAAFLDALEPRADRDAAILLLRDAFDLLSQEDVGQERFFTAVRATAKAAGATPARRALVDAIVRKLEI